MIVLVLFFVCFFQATTDLKIEISLEIISYIHLSYLPLRMQKN